MPIARAIETARWRSTVKAIVAQRTADINDATRLCEDAKLIAVTCRQMAGRFQAGGKLLVFGNGVSSTDAQHIAVEFLHPVIVGKRALPALALTNDIPALTSLANHGDFDDAFACQVRLLGKPVDIAMGVSCDGNCISVKRGLRVAREHGLLTIALCGSTGGAIAQDAVADFLLTAPSEDPLITKELQMTTYHIIWELVHVFCEQHSNAT